MARSLLKVRRCHSGTALFLEVQGCANTRSPMQIRDANSTLRLSGITRLP